MFELHTGTKVHIKGLGFEFDAEFQDISRESENFPNWIKVVINGKPALLNPDNVLIMCKI